MIEFSLPECPLRSPFSNMQSLPDSAYPLLDHSHSLLPTLFLPYIYLQVPLGEDIAGHLLPLFGNSVLSSVHREWELRAEGLLSWHSTFPHHSSNLLSPPQALCSPYMLHTPATHLMLSVCTHPCALMQVNPSVFCHIISSSAASNSLQPHAL